MRNLILGLCVVLGAFAPAMAEGPEAGESEVQLSFSYSDVDLGEENGVDFGESTDINFSLSYGWYITDHHEVGGILSYTKSEITSTVDEVTVEIDTDGYGVGAFYHYNFSSGNVATPYLGVAVQSIGGDAGDVYDLSYEAQLGVKFYPFDNAGVLLAASYSQLMAAEDGLPDADGIQLVAGLLIKY